MDLTFIIPYSRVSYVSALPPTELTRRLRELMQDRGFGGNVWHDGFSLGDHDPGRNSYAPIVRGTIIPLAGIGSRVSAVIAWHPVITILYLAVVVTIALASVRDWRDAVLLFFMLLVAHTALCIVGYAPIARRAHDLLCAAGEAG
jgi:hypothetical protein